MKKIFGFFTRKPTRFFLIPLGVIFIDQLVKIIVKLTLGAEYHEAGCQDSRDIHVIGNVFKITFAENPGAAFSMTFSDLFPFLTPVISKLILTLFSFLAVSLIIYFMWRVRKFPTALPYLIALILGGALGNIVDRMFYGVIFCDSNCSAGLSGDADYYPCTLMHGRVVDMFYLDLWHGFIPNWVPFFGGKYYALWPIFNVADFAISTGIVSIILFQKRLFGMRKKKEVDAVENADENIKPGI